MDQLKVQFLIPIKISFNEHNIFMYRETQRHQMKQANTVAYVIVTNTSLKQQFKKNYKNSKATQIIYHMLKDFQIKESGGQKHYQENSRSMCD